MGNFGCGDLLPENGSISILNINGIPISPPEGIVNNNYRVQGLLVDKKNNIWMCSYGNNRIVVYLNSDPNNSVFIQLPNNSNPFDIVMDEKQNMFVSLNGNNTLNVPSKVLKLELDNINSINIIFELEIGENIIGLALDSNNNVFACSNATNSVFKISNDGQILDEYKEGIFSPWGCCIDGNDTLFIGNFNTNLLINIVINYNMTIIDKDIDSQIMCGVIIFFFIYHMNIDLFNKNMIYRNNMLFFYSKILDCNKLLVDYYHLFKQFIVITMKNDKERLWNWALSQRLRVLKD